MGTHNANLSRALIPFPLRRRTTLELLRQLVLRCLQDAEENETEWNGSDQVILETELHSCRFLLIRVRGGQGTATLLSPREQEIVRLVAQGHPNKVIAAVLNISTWTVCTHLKRIFTKLGVCSRAAMVARLIGSEKIVEQQPLRPIGARSTEMPMKSQRFGGKQPSMHRSG
jgi:DNA-binding CsgD family transcriptional regulator